MDKELLDKLNAHMKEYCANYGEKMAKMTSEEQETYHKSIPDMGGKMLEEMSEFLIQLDKENLDKV
jgi:hypothetical protein